MSKAPYGTYALQSALQQLRKRVPELVYEVSYTRQGTIFNGFLIARNKTRFRPVGILDWAHFTKAGLGIAIEFDALQEYYEEMLKDQRSPNNVWKNKDKEHILKEQYANE